MTIWSDCPLCQGYGKQNFASGVTLDCTKCLGKGKLPTYVPDLGPPASKRIFGRTRLKT
jgi:hypothetical protein